MASFLIGEQEGFPSVSYIRAIDIYLITCFVFVFGCMVEYAIVHYAKRFAEKGELQKKSNKEVLVNLWKRDINSVLILVSFGYEKMCKDILIP